MFCSKLFIYFILQYFYKLNKGAYLASEKLCNLVITLQTIYNEKYKFLIKCLYILILKTY